MFPLVYFIVLLFLFYRKSRRFDMSCFIVCIYIVTSLFSIINESAGLRYGDSVGYTVSLEASIAYCALLTICIIPIRIASVNHCVTIAPVRNVKAIKAVSWVGVVYFCVFIVLASGSIFNALTGDMQSMRADVYNATSNQDWMLSLPAVVRIPCSFLNLFFGCPWILLLLAFYCYIDRSLPRKYCFFLVLASLIDPLNGIVGLDRSKITYWLVSFVACYILLNKQLTKQQKKLIKRLSFLIVLGFVLYLSAMTIQRFADKSSGAITGTEVGIITYLGEPYVNFCYFYDNYTPVFPSLEKVFPFTYDYILNLGSGSTVYNSMVYDRTGVYLGVFYTYIGDILISAGKSVAIVYCIVFSLLCLILSSRNKHSQWDINCFFIHLAFSSVLFLGMFTHYYAAAYRTFSLVFFWVLLSLTQRK